MKTLIVTIPIRPEPETFPPIGSLSIMNYIRRQGYEDVAFYDIDAFRPSIDEAVEHIISVKPDVLGISAVVSTAYSYSKKLSLRIKEALPDTMIVLGGNLAASAEIILRKTGVDICVTGEGEITLHKILQRMETTRDLEQYADIPGLVFLNAADQVVNTGYEEPLDVGNIYDISYDDLERYSRRDHYIYNAFREGDQLVWSPGAFDQRTYEPHRREKRMATLSVGKGCVAKCTFCHRWDKGIRHIPIDVLMKRIDLLIERYNIGFLDLHIESFGSDRRWLEEFCERIKPYDLLWRASGVRARSVTPEVLDMVKECGCVSFIYGFETGSAEMLQIMEKKIPMQTNFDAAKWTLDAGMLTVAQFVVGMPGESNATIKETTEFAKFVYVQAPWLKPNMISINYVQALPGTPIYEYARRKGVIGSSIDAEEEYLQLVSDRNACDSSVSYNYTDAPMIDWYSWRPRIVNAVNRAYIKTFGLDQFIRVLNGESAFATKGGQAWVPMQNVKPLDDATLRRLKMRFLLTGLPKIIIYTTPVLWWGAAFINTLRMRDDMASVKRREQSGVHSSSIFVVAAFVLGEYFNSVVKGLRGDRPNKEAAKSLRKVLAEDIPPLDSDIPEMQPLRNGR